MEEMHENNNDSLNRQPSFVQAVLCFAGIFAMISSGLFLFHISLHAIMFLCLIWTGLHAVSLGHRFADIRSMMNGGISRALPAIYIFILIGMVIASYMQSGTIASLIFYGLNLLTPGIFLAAGFIIYEAVDRIREVTGLESIELGIGIMAVSALVNFFVSRHLHRVARSADSVALEADAWHLTTDVYTSLGVTAGLVAVRVTGLTMLDPIIAIVVAMVIMRAAWNITRKSVGGLLDVRLPEDEEAIIRASITEHLGEVVGFHKLRTRKSGSQRYVDVHLVLPKSATLEEAHSLCDHLEGDIRHKLANGLVTIHCEPCELDHDDACPPDCPVIRCSVHVDRQEGRKARRRRLIIRRRSRRRHGESDPDGL
jgi:cation diffusion facilitator family transporter